MLPLTIILLSYNEEDNLPACLDSIQDIQAHRFVVDSYSTDRTLSILKKRKITYVQHPFQNYAAQRNWAQVNNPFQTKWVLHLDAGERATPEFVNWINNSFSSENQEVDGYLVARRAIFMGRWIKYGGYHPIYHLRLFKTEKGRCENKAYDQHFISEGTLKTLPKNADIEDTVMSNIRDFTVKHARWAIFEAAESIHSQKAEASGDVKANLLGNPIERRRWFKKNVFQKTPLFARSIFYFLYRYFFKLGFLDGKEGLVFHTLQGFWFRFLVDSVILEIQKELPYQSLDEILNEKYNLELNTILGNAELQVKNVKETHPTS
ncbi:MAG: glycosyltransferase family 2 protein [Bacteroidota bacterium]